MRWLLVFWLCVVPLVSVAAIYKWVGEDGEVVFTAEPPPDGVPYEVMGEDADTPPEPPPSRRPPAKGAETASGVTVVDWTNRLSPSKRYYYVEGILRNAGPEPARFVKVTIVAEDSSGGLVAIEDTYADPMILAPGQEATFQDMIPALPRIKRFRLRVNWR